MIRTFIAIELPAEIKTALGEIQNELRRTGADVGWVQPSNIHLTLKFPGDLDETQVALLRATTSQCVTTHKSFEMNTSNIGFFPNPKRARVIWVGLEGDVTSLMNLQKNLDRDLAAAGFPADDRLFSPHLTIGRIRSSKNLRALTDKTTEINFKATSFSVDHITVMRSQLNSAGSIYTPLEKCRLQRE